MENTFVNIGGHKVSAGKKYSTSEVKTGDVWIDGKPIYRKVISIASLPNATTTSYAHGIANLDKGWFGNGGYLAFGDYFYPIPFASTNSASTTTLYADKTSIYVTTGIDRSSWSAEVVLEYTKTTD